MADKQTVYEVIAESIRKFGYAHVTAAMVREVDETPDSERAHGVVSMFANKQLDDARQAGLLPPKAS